MQTIYFSDSPARAVGALPMQQFLDGLAFTPDNPPNAALVTWSGDEEDVVVIELRKPVYDADSGNLTHDAQVLEGYAEDGRAFVAARKDEEALAERFGHTSLFIDDCNNIVNCYRLDANIFPLEDGSTTSADRAMGSRSAPIVISAMTRIRRGVTISVFYGSSSVREEWDSP